MNKMLVGLAGLLLLAGCALPSSAQEAGEKVDGLLAQFGDALPSFDEVKTEVEGLTNAITIASDAKEKQAIINLGPTGCDVTRINAPFDSRVVLVLKASGGQQSFKTDDGDPSTAEINTLVEDGKTRTVSVFTRRPEITYSSGLLCHGTIVSYKQ